MKFRFILLLLVSFLLFPVIALSVGAEESNLALGKKYKVKSDFANEKSYKSEDKDDGSALTDGVFASNSWSDPKWSKFYRAGGRTVTIDLENICEIERVSTNFISDNAAGCFMPEKIDIYVSADGENFSRCEIKSGNTAPYGPYDKRGCAIINYDMPIKNVAARYVALHFDVSVNTFIDEIEIFGKTETTLTPPTDYADILPAPKGEFLSRDALGGDKDIILFHTGYYPSDETLVNNVESTFLPFIAYIENGKIKDTMFDSVMFLIIQGICPSGGGLGVSGTPTVKSDWDMVLDQYFSEEYNLKALNDAVNTMNQALGTDKKISVYLTCPYPKISDISFGDYDGDGKDNKIETYDDCLKVSEWFVGECIRRFDENKYENLVFKGFFCNNEGLGNERYCYEKQYAKDMSALLKNKGLAHVMIPFYQARGIEDWEDTGFAAALMQPNVAFNAPLQKDPQGAFEDFTETAKALGLGIEMEANSSLVWEPEKCAANYAEYLKGALAGGLMTDTLHAYYNGAGAAVFGRGAYSKDENLRWIYDCTYKFIKGTLDLPQDVLAEGFTPSLEVEHEGRAQGITGVLGDWKVDFVVTRQPSHGFVVKGINGQSFTYTADRQFEGEDSFDYKLVVFGETVAERTVEITVKGENAPQEVSDESEFIPNDSSHKALRIAAYSAIAAACLAALVITLRKGKKKGKK